MVISRSLTLPWRFQHPAPQALRLKGWIWVIWSTAAPAVSRADADAHDGAPEMTLADADAHDGAPEMNLAEAGAHDGAPETNLADADAHDGAPEMNLANSDAHEGAPECFLADGMAQLGVLPTLVRGQKVIRSSNLLPRSRPGQGKLGLLRFGYLPRPGIPGVFDTQVQIVALFKGAILTLKGYSFQ